MCMDLGNRESGVFGETNSHIHLDKKSGRVFPLRCPGSERMDGVVGGVR